MENEDKASGDATTERSASEADDAQARELADDIVDRLFTNGRGDKARRLVLELEDGGDGGGWCRSAVRDQILEALSYTPKGAPWKSTDGAQAACGCSKG